MGKRSREKHSRRADPAPSPQEAAPRRAEQRAEARAEGRAERRSERRTEAPFALLPPAAPRPAAPEAWSVLWRRHRVALLSLFGLALVVRAIALFQISRTPYFEVANIDSIAYQQWAARIAEGGWWPAGTFYQSPLYAYFLAVLHTVFGPPSWSPRVLQVLLGSLSPALVYAIGTQLFSRRVGWIAGIGLALYGPIVLEEVTFSKTTLLVTTSLAGFALYLRAAPYARLRGMVAAGVLFGISVVGVGQWLLPFLGLAAWAVFMPATRRGEWSFAGAAAFAAGGLAIILPLVVWNTAHGGGLVLTSGDAGLNFFNGNNEIATGLPAPPAGLRDTPQYEEADARRLAERAVGRPLSPAEVARYWSSRGTAWIRENPGDWIALLGKKLATLWNGFEIPDNYHYAFMRTNFLPALYAMITFSLVAPLALVGGVMPFWRRRDVTALYVVCFGYVATMLIFYIRGRYRLPAVPLLMVLAAVGVDRVVRAIEARRWPAVAALAGGLALAGLYTNREYCEAPHHGMQSVCLGGDTWFDGEWLKLAEWYRNAGQLDPAVAYAARARECTRPRSPGQADFWVGEIETMRTERAMREGRTTDAQAYLANGEKSFREALRLGHRTAATQSNLGSLYFVGGKPAEAITAFETAQKTGRIDPAALRRFARSYVAVGRCADAEQLLARADRERGLGGPSPETQSILQPCGGGS